MNAGGDFVPRKDADFTAFFENLERMVDANTHGPNPPWTHIPQEAASGFSEALGRWKDAYVPTLSPHIPEATHEKNRVRASSEKYFRHFVNQYIRYSDEVTDQERDQAGVPNPHRTRARVKRPEDSPAFTVEVAGPGMLRIRLHQEASARTAIPPGYGGAVIYRKILDKRPAGPEALTESGLATSSIHTLYFGESDWGKKVYISLCWQTKSGLLGPPSPIQESVIP
jgi:hypothetical protein